MRARLTVVLLAVAFALPVAAQEPPTQRPLPVSEGVAASDAPWRRAVADHVEAHFRHPGWGARHAERNYLSAHAIARAEGLAVDDDVLFAASYLHDWGGLKPFAVEGTAHEQRSVELAEPFLRQAGFPMEKWPGVREAILAHVPAGQPASPEATVLRDADLIDFLGAEGVARLLAATEDDRSDMDQALRWIEGFADSLPGRLTTAETRQLAEPRAGYMKAFLAQLRSELPAGSRP
jgi:uncharacterized protein